MEILFWICGIWGTVGCVLFALGFPTTRNSAHLKRKEKRVQAIAVPIDTFVQRFNDRAAEEDSARSMIYYQMQWTTPGHAIRIVRLGRYCGNFGGGLSLPILTLKGTIENGNSIVYTLSGIPRTDYNQTTEVQRMENFLRELCTATAE